MTPDDRRFRKRSYRQACLIAPNTEEGHRQAEQALDDVGPVGRVVGDGVDAGRVGRAGQVAGHVVGEGQRLDERVVGAVPLLGPAVVGLVAQKSDIRCETLPRSISAAASTHWPSVRRPPTPRSPPARTSPAPDPASSPSLYPRDF